MNEVPSQPVAGDERWAELGKRLRLRREQLGLAQHDLASRGGPSAATVRYAENGQAGPFRNATILAFERALQWEPGSFMDVLYGGEPKVTVQQRRSDDDQWKSILERVEEQLQRIGQVPDAVASDSRAVKIPDDAWSTLAGIANREDLTIPAALVKVIDAYEHQTAGR